MKYISKIQIALFLSCLMISCSQRPEPSNPFSDWEKEHLRGRVKQLITYQQYRNDTLPIISEYDTLGRLTFRQDHFNDVFFTKETFIYQFPICIWDPPSYSKDSLTGQDQMEYHETYVKDFLDTPLQGSLDVFFLSENRIITRNDDGQISHIAYQEGKIVYFNYQTKNGKQYCTEVFFNNGEEVVFSLKIDYDDKGNLQRLRSFGEKNTLSLEIGYTPDRQIKSITNYDRELKEEKLYHYNDKGQLIKEIRYDQFIAEYQYNDKNQVVEETEYNTKFPLDQAEKYRYQYTPQGDISRRELSYKKEDNTTATSVTTYRYKYDTQGNWTLKQTYRNGKYIEHQSRKIVYY